MFRYLALFWDPRKLSARSAASDLVGQIEKRKSDWHAGFSADGVRVYYVRDRRDAHVAYTLPAQQGTVLGRLFRQGSETSISSFSATDALLAVQTRGRCLIDKFWGNYVAVIRDEHGPVSWIVRDPAGLMRCFHTLYRGTTIVFSNAQDVADLGLPFTFDWGYVAAEVSNRATMGWRRTGLSEVASLLPGECLEIRPSSLKTLRYWDPIALANNAVEERCAAVRLVRESVRQSVRAWASCYEHILVLLSGGLDSSIVAACLRSIEGVHASCLNLYYPSHLADERAFAMIAAERSGFPLVTLQRPTSVSLESLLQLPKSARPSSNHTDQIMFRNSCLDLARNLGADALFDGQMGDQLFCKRLERYAAIDFVRTKGFRRELLQVVADMSEVCARPLYPALCEALFFGFSSRYANHSLANRWAKTKFSSNPFVRKDAINYLNYRLSDEWLESCSSLPVGKMFHLGFVQSAQAYFDVSGRSTDSEWLMPLNSQPVIEACLRLPIHLVIRGGWDRSIAREAFAEDLPTEIVNRRTKGLQGRQLDEVFRKGRSFMEELLVDGILVREGILSAKRLKKVFGLSDPDLCDPMLQRCLRSEAWLRVWSGHRIGAVQRGSFLELTRTS